MRTLKFKLFMLTLLFIGVVAMSFTLVNREKPEVKPEAEQTSYIWFQISNDHDPLASVPPGDATFVGIGTEPPSEADDCEGNTKQCVSGFSEGQTIENNGNYTLNGAQAPQALAPNVLRN